MKDQVFGEMEYIHSWKKKENFVFLGKAYIVNIIAQAYKGDIILKSQQSNYLKFKKYLEQNKTKIKEKLNQFGKTTYNVENLLDKSLIPTAIIFERDDSWGVLFDTYYDTEHGVALFVVDDKLNIDTQDTFL